MVAERADALLTGAAGDFLLQMDGAGIEGLGPGDVGRAEQRHDGGVEGSGEMQKVSVLFQDHTSKKFVVKYARLEII